MDYEVIENGPDYAGNVTSIVHIKRDDGSFEVFAADETNPRYVQFQEELAAEEAAAK